MYNKYIKSALDRTVAAVALIILALPLTLVALIIKLESPGPAIRRQMRSGANGREFCLYKFRSMLDETPRDVPTASLEGSHDYITGFGRIIRKLSIDELPQLINVLKGDMSIIGYRPLIDSGTDSAIIAKRHDVGVTKAKPGITGWAQVNGRDFIDGDTKVAYDKYYVDHLSFWMDVRVLWNSIFAVATRKGYREGSRINTSGDHIHDKRGFGDEVVDVV